MRPVKLPLQPLVKQAIQRAPRERRRWAPTRRGFMIPGAIAGILVVVFGAVFAHVYVPVHAAPQALA